MANRGDGGGGGKFTSTSSFSDVVREVIDTSGKTPKLLVTALVARIVAAIVWGFELGLVLLIRRVAGGIFGVASDLEAWIADSGGLIPALFAIPRVTWLVAVEQTARLVGTTGIFAQALATIVVFVLFAAVAWTAVALLEQAIRVLTGGR